ncbi:MAG: sugar ABC transporter permease [Caldilinea sp.]|nr:sugar ABC transporter permease [Caldilinea sp.]MDW8441547.1 sugar ABC transporter permease [Caldilineaceae bacterium]
MSRFFDRHQRWLFPAPAVIFIVLMMIFPLAYTLWNSFSGWSLTAGRPNTFIGPQNYFDLMRDGRFWNAVWNTFYFTALAMALEMTLGIAMALLIDARDYPGKRIVTSILLLPMMATPVAVAMVWLLMFEPTAGVINYVLGQLGMPKQLWIAGSTTVIPSLVLVDVWEWTPLITLIVLAGLAGLPSEPFEAARVDGASYWQTLWRVTLPMLLPTISVAGLLRFIDCIKTFDIIYGMTGGGPGFSSETLNIYTYNQAFYYFNFGYASSLLVIFFTIVAGVSLLVAYSRRRLEV